MATIPQSSQPRQRWCRLASGSKYPEPACCSLSIQNGSNVSTQQGEATAARLPQHWGRTGKGEQRSSRRGSQAGRTTDGEFFKIKGLLHPYEKAGRQPNCEMIVRNVDVCDHRRPSALLSKIMRLKVFKTSSFMQCQCPLPSQPA